MDSQPSLGSVVSRPCIGRPGAASPAAMNFVNEVRYGLGTMSKTPGFALTAIVTMALGIGATTAIFSVCDAMMWKPVPIPHLETLATVLERHPDDPHDYGGG